MTENKKIKYCYREVDFYRDGFIALVFAKVINGDAEFIYSMTPVYKNIKELAKDLKKFKKEMKDQKDPVDIYGSIVIKIKFCRTSPLKKEFWTTESEINLNHVYQSKQYMEVLKNEGKLYKIMVMPHHYDIEKKAWTLTNWLPVLSTITDEELGKIAIMSTTTQVDVSAKSMALYSIEWIKGYDIVLGELIEKNKEGLNQELN